MSTAKNRASALIVLAMSVALAANLFTLQPQKTAPALETSAIGSGAATLAVTDVGPKISADKTEVSLAAAPVSPRFAKITEERRLPPIIADAPTAVEVIRGVQRELSQRGYEAGVADGVSGLVTRAAVMAYEFDHGLPLTAEPDDDLLNHIVLGPSTVDRPKSSGGQRRPSRAEDVTKLVQKWLADRGFNPGKIDGRLSEATARAIRAFEQKEGLKVTGRVSGELVSRLARKSALSKVSDAR